MNCSHEEFGIDTQVTSTSPGAPVHLPLAFFPMGNLIMSPDHYWLAFLAPNHETEELLTQLNSSITLTQMVLTYGRDHSDLG